MSDSNLLDQISKLRGAINNCKTEPKDLTSNKPYDASYRGGSARGRGRGRFRGRGGFPVRNRTLIVNNNSTSDPEFVSTVSSNGRKLINKSIYEKELQEKNLTKEEKIERLKEAKHKITMKKLETRASKNRVRLDLCDRCVIDGDLFAISRYGARLVLLDVPSGVKPKKINWNGYEYERVKTGNLKLVNTKVFLKEQCRYFQMSGECSRGANCKYTHNSSKVALCKNYIRGKCQGDCSLSHEPNEYNVPICHFFAKGACKNPQCLFLHVKPELELICRPFAIGGYCFRGKNCKFTHSFECPDYQLTRECPRGKGCKLTHSQKDNLDAKLIFNTLNPDYYQLPNLTRLDNLHDDPRIQKSEIEEDISKFDDYDSESDGGYDSDNFSIPTQSTGSGTDGLEINADFIHF